MMNIRKRVKFIYSHKIFIVTKCCNIVSDHFRIVSKTCSLTMLYIVCLKICHSLSITVRPQKLYNNDTSKSTNNNWNKSFLKKIIGRKYSHFGKDSRKAYQPKICRSYVKSEQILYNKSFSDSLDSPAIRTLTIQIKIKKIKSCKQQQQHNQNPTDTKLVTQNKLVLKSRA